MREENKIPGSKTFSKLLFACKLVESLNTKLASLRTSVEEKDNQLVEILNQFKVNSF